MSVRSREDSSAAPVELVIHRNSFADDGDYLRVVDALRSNHTSKLVDLSNNNLDDSILRRLLAALETNKTIVSIILNWNKLNSNIGLLSSLFEVNDKVEHVELKNNDIDDEGANIIAQSLLNNTTLKTLDLRWNHIGDDGAASLLNMMKAEVNQANSVVGSHRMPLRRVLLQGNFVSPSLLDQFHHLNADIVSQVLPVSLGIVSSKSNKDHHGSSSNSDKENIAFTNNEFRRTTDLDLSDKIDNEIENSHAIAKLRIQVDALRQENSELK